MSKDYKDKVALVTGAAQGIGRQVALDLSERSADVVVCDIKGEEANEVSEEVKAKGVKSDSFQVDVSSSEQVEEMVEKVHEKYGKIDVLVNNAGVLNKGTIEDVNDERLQQTFSVNLYSIFYLTRTVVPRMKENNYGRIVNISSITGVRGDNTTLPCYGASKGAIVTLTKSLGRELGPSGITVNSVAPHAIMTDLMSYWTEEKKEKARQGIPVRRLGSAEDVSNTVLFLASDRASYITGQTINVNGGYYM